MGQRPKYVIRIGGRYYSAVSAWKPVVRELATGMSHREARATRGRLKALGYTAEVEPALVAAGDVPAPGVCPARNVFAMGLAKVTSRYWRSGVGLLAQDLTGELDGAGRPIVITFGQLIGAGPIVVAFLAQLAAGPLPLTIAATEPGGPVFAECLAVRRSDPTGSDGFDALYLTHGVRVEFATAGDPIPAPGD